MKYSQNRHFVRRVLLGALPVLSAVSGVAYADNVGGGLEEIVVTATKRSEDVQQVPISITAVSAEALQAKGITQISQLSAMAPNVTLDAGTPFSGSGEVLAAYIRGIGQNDFAFNQDPGVGVYVDGVYLARSVGSNTSMLDVDRVEILKGPQGTLFGRNSVGGAISIVTREPGKVFMAKGEVTTGAFARSSTKVTMDLPLTDTISTTLSFSTDHRDGYMKRIPYTGTNVASGTYGTGLEYIPDCGPVGAPCTFVTDNLSNLPASGVKTSDTEGGIGNYSVRGKLVWHASDAIKFTVMGDYLNVNQSAMANTIAAVNAGGLSGLYNACLLNLGPPTLCDATRGGLPGTPNPGTATPVKAMPPIGGINNDGNPYNNMLPFDSRFVTGNIDTTYATGNSFDKMKNWGGGTVLDWDIGNGMAVKWINAYRELDWQVGMDLDGSPMSILQTSFDMYQHQISEELQLNGTAMDGRLIYATGLYYFKEGGHLHDFVVFPGALLMVDGPNFLSTEAKAIFAHADYKLTDNWGFTVGVRATKEHKTFIGQQTDDNGLSYKASGCVDPTAPNNLGAPSDLTCQQVLGYPVDGHPYTYYPPGTHVQDFNNTSPTVGVQYHLDQNAMAYASWSKGFKTGSWTTRLSNPHPTYDSSLHFDPETASSSEIGYKSELFDRHVRLNLAAFYTDYKNIQLNSQQGISPTLLNAGDAKMSGFELETEAVLGHGWIVNFAAGTIDAKYTRIAPGVGDNGVLITLDTPLPKTPKFKAYFAPQYTMDLGSGGELVWNADYAYTAKLSNDLGNSESLSRAATSVVNASVTYKAPSHQWEFVLGASNLTDERYIVSGQNQGGAGLTDLYYSRPREWFATVRFNPGAK